MTTTVRVLCFGDVVGTSGVRMFQRYAQPLKQQYKADVIIVNGENSAANGRGMTPEAVEAFRASGAQMITGGNHSFQKRELFPVLATAKDILRPINFPSGCPGVGIGFIKLASGADIAVINVQLRIFMREQLSCPFRAVESVLPMVYARTRMCIVDAHGEATSEKAALAYYFDGKVSAVYGTHTHVQTADERILPQGTGFITDIGMTGAVHSLIGMKRDPIIQSMLTQLPTKFEVDEVPPFRITGVIMDIDVATGKTYAIDRFSIVHE